MADHLKTLSLILNLIRSGQAVTRPELVQLTGLGRNVVAQRVEQALAAGLVREDETGISTGGRPSRRLAVGPGRGAVLGAVFGASRLHLALATVDGRLVGSEFLSWDVDAGPRPSLDRFTSLAAKLLAAHPELDLWSVAVGLPGPVDVAPGRPVAPPIMAGWDGYPVRTELEAHFEVPVWVDNDVNLMALGAWKETRPAAGDDVLLIKAGTGIGAGLISRGRLHRGARGSAGDFGHIVVANESAVQCRCGNFGCLEALAGGWALARDARDAASARRSPYLREVTGSLSVDDVIRGCLAGDEVCRELVVRSGTLIGASLASLVSFFNPATVFLAGSLTRTGQVFLDSVIQGVQRRALTLATEELLITAVPLNHYEDVLGAVELAVDSLLAPEMLALWLPKGAPRGLRAHRERAAPAAGRAERIESLSSVADRLSGLHPLPL